MIEPLPEEVWRQQRREISDELLASLGVCLAAVVQPPSPNSPRRRAY